MSDVGGGDIPPLEAELILNLDQFFAQKNRIGPALLAEFQSLQNRIGPTLQKGLEAGLKGMPRQFKVQLDKSERVTAATVKSINERLASVGTSGGGSGLAAGLEQEQARIHEVITKIVVDFSELRRAVEEANAVQRDRLDFAKGYTDEIVRLGDLNRAQREQTNQSREANILLRADLSKADQLRRASLKEQDRISQLGVSAATTANRQMLIADKAMADAVAQNRRKLTQTVIEDEKRQTSAIIEGNRQTTIAVREAAAKQIESAKQVTAQTKSGGVLQVEEAKRIRDQQSQLAKTALSEQEHIQSTLRIREQAEQQARLARTQQFYKLVGDAARKSAEVVGSAARGATSLVGNTASRLFHVEHSGNVERIDDFRRTAEQIDRVTIDGYDRQLSATRSFFTREGRLEREGLRAQRRSAGVSGVGGTVSDKLQNRTSKGLLGVATGQSGLNLLLGGLGVGGLAAAIGAASKESSDFESSLKRVQAASGATNKQIEQVRKTTLKFGADIHIPGLAAADAADTFRLLAVSGISVKTALDGAAYASLLLSRATKSSAEDSAKAISSAVNAFKLRGSQAQQVADIVARSIDKSGVSLAEFTQAFTQAGVTTAGIFKDAQKPIQTIKQLSALLALFARNGLRGSQAGTNLKVMFQNLAAPKSAAAATAIHEITQNAGESGDILYDAAGKTRTFASALEILRKGYNKLPTDASKAQVLKDIFGTRASIGARILLGADQKTFDTVTHGLNSTGFAAKYAEAQFTGFNKSWAQLKAVLRDAVDANFKSIQAGAGKVLNIFARLVYYVTQGNGAWATLRAGLKGVGVALAGIIAAKGGVEVLGLLKDVAKGLVFNPETGALSGVKLLSLGFVGLAAILSIVLSKSKSARAGVASLISGVKTAAGDIGRITGQAFGALISGAEQLYKTEFPKLKAGYKSVASDLSKGFHGTTSDAGLSGVLEHIGGEAQSIAALFSRIGGNAKVAFTGSKTIAQRFAALFAGLGPLVDRALGGLPSKIGGVIAKIRAGFEGTSITGGFLTGLGRGLKAVADGAETAYRYIKAVVEVVGGLLRQGYQGITGGGGLVGVLRGIGNAARDAVELVSKLGSNLGDAVSGGGSLGDRLAKVFSGLAPIVNDLFGGIPEKIGSVIRTKLIDPVEAEFDRFFGNGSSIVVGILGLLRDVGLRIGRTVTGVITDPNVLKVVGGTLLAAGAGVLAAVEGLIQGVIEKILSRVPGALSTAIGFAISHIPTLLAAVFLGIPLLLGKALVAGVKFLKDAIVGVFSPGGGISTLWGKLVKTLSGTLAVGLLGVFALKTLAGPLKGITKFFSDNFGSAARAGLKAAITGDQAGLDSIVTKAAKKAEDAARVDKSSSTAFPGITGNVISGVSQLRAGLTSVGTLAGTVRTKIGDLASGVKFIGSNAVAAAREASPAFDAFATKVGTIWTSVREGASTAFEKVKSYGGLAFNSLRDAAQTAYEKIGGIQGIAQAAGTAVAGFFSGQGIASNDLSSKIAGIGGAVASIGFAVSTGSPLIIGLSLAGTLLGIITGNAEKSAENLRSMRDAAADFTKELIDAQKTGDFGPVLQDEQNKVLDLVKTFRDGFTAIDNKVGGLRGSLNKAFSEIGTGKIQAGLDALNSKFTKFGRSVVDDLFPEDALNEVGPRLRKLVPTADIMASILGSKNGITVSSRATANQVVAALRAGIIDAASKGKIPARDLFDTFSIQKVGDQFKVIRNGIEGANGDIQKFLDQTGSDVLSLYQGYKDVNGEVGKQLDLTERVTAAQQQLGPLTLDQASFIDLINQKLSVQQSRLTDIQTQFDALDGKDVRDQNSKLNDLASSAVDTTKAILANGSQVPTDPFDISGTAQQVQTTLPELVNKYNDIVAGIVGSKDPTTGQDITPQFAATLAQNVKDRVIAAARKAGADRSTVEALNSALNVPTADAITGILTRTDEQQVRNAAQQQVSIILDQVQKNKGVIPVALQAYIGNLNTPEGLALQALINSGQIVPPATGHPIPRPFQTPHRVPGLARGDVVNKPTLGIFGEAGPEVIVPLSKPDRMVELLTQALHMGGHMPAFADGGIIGNAPLARAAGKAVSGGFVTGPKYKPGSKLSKDMITFLAQVGGVPRSDVHESRADRRFYTEKNAEVQAIIAGLVKAGEAIQRSGPLAAIYGPNSSDGLVVIDGGSGTKVKTSTAVTPPAAPVPPVAKSNLSGFVRQTLANLGHFPAADVHQRKGDGAFYTKKNSEVQAVISALGGQLTAGASGLLVYQSPSGPILLDGTAGSKAAQPKTGVGSGAKVALPDIPTTPAGDPIQSQPLGTRLELLASWLRLAHWGYGPAIGDTAGLTSLPAGGLTPPEVTAWKQGDNVIGYSPAPDRPILRLDDPAWLQTSTSTADGLQKLVAHLGDLGYYLPDDTRSVQAFANGAIVGKPPTVTGVPTKLQISREPLTNQPAPPISPPPGITQNPKWMIQALKLLSKETQTYANWFNFLRATNVPIDVDIPDINQDAQFIVGAHQYWSLARDYVKAHKPKGTGRLGGNYLKSDVGQIDALSSAYGRQMWDSVLAFQNYAGPASDFIKHYALLEGSRTAPRGKQPVFAANGIVATRPTLGVIGEAGPEIVLPLSRPDRAQNLLDRTGLQSKGDKDLTAAIGDLVAALSSPSTSDADRKAVGDTFHITETASARATAREVVQTQKRKGRR